MRKNTGPSRCIYVFSTYALVHSAKNLLIPKIYIISISIMFILCTCTFLNHIATFKGHVNSTFIICNQAEFIQVFKDSLSFQVPLHSPGQTYANEITLKQISTVVVKKMLLFLIYVGYLTKQLCSK